MEAQLYIRTQAPLGQAVNTYLSFPEESQVSLDSERLPENANLLKPDPVVVAIDNSFLIVSLRYLCSRFRRLQHFDKLRSSATNMPRFVPYMAAIMNRRS